MENKISNKVNREWIKLSLYFLVMLILVVGGYSLFLWFIVNIMKGEVVYGLLFVALVAGVASFFNPCAFPLLPAYLAQYYTTKEGKEVKSTSGILLSGLAASLGVITFNILLGGVIGILGAGFGKSLGLTGDNPNLSVRWLRGIVGVLLLYLGFSHATGKGNPFEKLAHLWHPKSPPKEISGIKKMYGYGFGYTLLGIGCGGPIMAGLFVFSFAQGGFTNALIAFSVYSMTMGMLMIIISFITALSKEALLTNLRKSTITIQRISGVLLLLVGAFLVLSSIYVTAFTNILFP